MRTVPRTSIVLRTAVAVAVATSLVAPGSPSGAQEGGRDGDGSGDLRRGNAELAIDIDVLRVADTEVTQALADIEANVEAQQAQLTVAEAQLSEAEAALATARTAVDETQAQIDLVQGAADAVVIDSYTNPPTESGIETLSAGSLSDITVKQSILNNKATSDAEILDSYQDLEDQRSAQLEEQAELADAAEATAADAEGALGDLESALTQQALFAVQVQQRLDQRLAEADSLAESDPELAAQILERESALAAILNGMQAQRRAEEAQERARELGFLAQQQRGYGVIKQPPGGIVNVNCPSGGTIEVAGDISGPVQRLLDDTAAAGLALCGSGFRDPQEQIAVRRSNCGTSYYLIYQAPSSACSPPTARPGTSMHEQGLAIDFRCGGSTVRWGDACHDWLEAHAAEYGLYQLPSESWHFSINGE